MLNCRTVRFEWKYHLIQVVKIQCCGQWKTKTSRAVICRNTHTSYLVLAHNVRTTMRNRPTDWKFENCVFVLVSKCQKSQCSTTRALSLSKPNHVNITKLLHTSNFIPIVCFPNRRTIFFSLTEFISLCEQNKRLWFAL